MLEALCGSRNVQKILLFLFVNGKCYGTQLNRLLKTSLTPIQKALLRLEKGGVVISYFEGKTRVYQFNPGYPLLQELEQLLKKFYTLLPPPEKKLYSVINEQKAFTGQIREENRQTLLAFWDRLTNIRHLSFIAKTKSQEEIGWNGKGKGEVLVAQEQEDTLIFTEKGTWQSIDGKEMDFSNIFRWTLDANACVISLEHLRRGYHQPVFLFDLAPLGNHSLSSVDSHLCDGDVYFGQIFFDKASFRLSWRVIGPKKNEEINYTYH